jgi:hypothetical protein
MDGEDIQKIRCKEVFPFWMKFLENNPKTWTQSYAKAFRHLHVIDAATLTELY